MKALPAGTMEGPGGQRSFGLWVVGGVARKEHVKESLECSKPQPREPPLARGGWSHAAPL